jgi:hypothetical protein
MSSNVRDQKSKDKTFICFHSTKYFSCSILQLVKKLKKRYSSTFPKTKNKFQNTQTNVYHKEMFKVLYKLVVDIKFGVCYEFYEKRGRFEKNI